MIVRVFRARVRAGAAADFEAKVRQESIPLVEAAGGVVSWWAGRPLGAAGEFVMVSIWQDLESLKAFAGPDWQREGVIPPDELPLLEETILHHYELIGSSA
jgi:quinol monooxygenase YgiN